MPKNALLMVVIEDGKLPKNRQYYITNSINKTSSDLQFIGVELTKETLKPITISQLENKQLFTDNSKNLDQIAETLRTGLCLDLTFPYHKVHYIQNIGYQSKNNNSQ